MGGNVMKKALALVLALGLLAGAKPLAGPSDDGMVFNLVGHHVVDPVDRQTWCGDCIGVDYTTGSPWTINPHDSWPYFLPSQGAVQTGCMWDADDYYRYASTGNTLGAGVSLSITECRYATPDLHPTFLTNIGITSSSPDLIVTERWSWTTGTLTHAIPAIFDTTSHKWSYFACLMSPGATGGTPTQVPNSHDGVAVPQLITVTVTNPTTRKINKTGGVIESGIISGQGRGCTSWTTP
jgi:hypothetical protein